MQNSFYAFFHVIFLLIFFSLYFFPIIPVWICFIVFMDKNVKLFSLLKRENLLQKWQLAEQVIIIFENLNNNIIMRIQRPRATKE